MTTALHFAPASQSVLVRHPSKLHLADSVIREMWPGGPLRRWSTRKTPQPPLGYRSGFVGSYLCAGCMEPCDGVYRVRELSKWLCGPCRTKSQLSEGRNEKR